MAKTATAVIGIEYLASAQGIDFHAPLATSAILRAANNVIGPNPKLFPKRLFSELGEGEPVRVVDSDHEQHEAERAVARIQSLRQASPHKEWRDFAILYLSLIHI